MKTNVFKTIKNIILVLIFLVLYCIPVIAIYKISTKEIDSYKIEIKDVFKEKAYGELATVQREDIRENYIVSGEVISDNYRYLKLPESDTDMFEQTVTEEQEVHVGDKVGHVGDTPVYSPVNGIVKGTEDINGETKLKVMSFDNLRLKITVPKDIVSFISGTLKDDNDVEYIVESKSNQVIDGGIDIVLSTKESQYTYGEKIEGLTLYTGKVYEDVITVAKDCVYQKPGSDAYYVRICSSEGEFVREQVVETGYETDDSICVTGLEEGLQCDMGYKYVIGADDQMAELATDDMVSD